MSLGLKSSPPYSSNSTTSFGMYGAGTINPYASYFGQHHQGQPSVVTTSSLGSIPVSASSGISVGSSPYFSPQVPQTKIIGGIDHSAVHPVSPIRGASQGVGNVMGSASATPGAKGMETSPPQEPMHYSPVGGGQSYGANAFHSSPSHPPVYLPCYFLGLDQPHHYQGGSPPSPGSGGLLGPGPRGLSSNSFTSPQPQLGMGMKRVLFEPGTVDNDPSSSQPSKPMEQRKTKKGPPIYGFGSSDTANSTQDFLDFVSFTEGDGTKGGPSAASNITSPILGGDFLSRRNMSPPTPAASTTPGSPSKCWVTVFGFPAGASSFIVNNFSTLGKILEVKCTPGSNWLHIRFSNPIEARRALTRNGKVLGQSIMVGVIPSDSKVIDEAEKANISGVSETPVTDRQRSFTPQKTSVDSSSPTTSSTRSGLQDSELIKSRLRPLARATLPPSALPPPTRSVHGMPCFAREALEVTSHSSNRPVPHTSTGVFTRAMEFMFGW